jgi:DNA-binding CsgD family transcriptional regulator/tetratricopeptide (TPR) repeat protein
VTAAVAEVLATEVDTRPVTRRVTSRTLIGRTGQRAALRASIAAARAGAGRIVLISGDAGIGKTRLVLAALDDAREAGLVTAVGGCIQLGEVSVAFAPVVEALRDIRRTLDEADFAELLESGGAEVQALLLGSAMPGRGSGPLFEHLLGFLTRLGLRHPLLLVFEDLHWADASTRDLIAFLGRNLQGTAVTFVLTYRADEMHRRHPLRPVIAQLERDPDVDRIELSGLERAEFGQLVGELCDTPLAPETVDHLLARSGGNPFYVEELVASDRLDMRLPETLAEVIMARVGKLSADTQAVLHAAAVVDDELDDELLAELTARPLGEVTAALREAVHDQLVTLDGDACRFRHALIREALYDDLLPGERTRLHVATAELLERTDRLVARTRWAMIAHHWDAAHRASEAFTASVRAGVEAEAVGAFADAAAQYERALGLRDQVPDAAERAGMSMANLLLRAAESVHTSSRSQRAVVLAEAALSELGAEAEPELRAMALERLGRINWTLHRGSAAVAAYEQAAALLAERPPSREQAFTLAALGQSLMLRARYRDATEVLERAIGVSAAVGASEVEGHASSSLGPCLVGVGRVEEGLAAMRRALALSTQAGQIDDVCRAHTNLLHSLYVAGRYDEAILASVEAIDYAVRTGHARHYGEAIAGNAIAAAICAGRWSDADAMRNDPRIAIGDPYQELRWLPMLVLAGRYAEAREAVRYSLDATAEADDVQFRAAAYLRAGELAAAEGQLSDARRLIADAERLASASDDHFYRAIGFGIGLRVEADRVLAAQDRRDEAVLAEVRADADLLIESARSFGANVEAYGSLLPEPRGWLVTAEAEYARACGRDDASTWAGVADVWDTVGQPLRAAQARYRQADILLRSRGDRDLAASLARGALEAAERIGAAPLAADIRQLARRGRLDLAAVQEAREQPDGEAALNVTARELEVLRLVAEGRTNRQIGTLLFISEKTASVHVSNLMRKLGVTNRVEAAAVAQRVGLH